MEPVRLLKTPISRVQCYYLGCKDGSLELYDMHYIDFEEAFDAHPDDWVLADEYKMPTGPSAPKVIDKRNYPVFPTPESMKSKGPPVLDTSLTMNQVKRKIRTGAAGAP